jgi:hypothetical protein
MPHFAAAFGLAYLLNQERRHEVRQPVWLPEPEEPFAAAPAAPRPAGVPVADEIEEGRGIAPVPVWRLFSVGARRPRLRASSGSS